MDFDENSDGIGSTGQILLVQNAVDQKLVQLMRQAEVEDERAEMPRRVQRGKMLVLDHMVVDSRSCSTKRKIQV
jgi:hypothetical protein